MALNICLNNCLNSGSTSINEKTYLAKGKRGIAYTGLLGAKKVLLKEWNPSADVNTIAHEARILKVVNEVGVGPKFISLINGNLVREFIDGPEFTDWIVDKDGTAIKKAMVDILDQCRRLDGIKINKLEMNHPRKHILMRRGKPVMIDFDRSKTSSKPKNVTQVCQWFTSGTLRPVLNSKGINLQKDKILILAKKYKESYKKSDYLKIKEAILNA